MRCTIPARGGVAGPGGAHRPGFLTWPPSSAPSAPSVSTGPWAALFADLTGDRRCAAGHRWPEVEVVTGRVLVDVHHTARNLFATGIQRVVRETARRWIRDHRT